MENQNEGGEETRGNESESGKGKRKKTKSRRATHPIRWPTVEIIISHAQYPRRLVIMENNRACKKYHIATWVDQIQERKHYSQETRKSVDRCPFLFPMEEKKNELDGNI